MRFITDTGRLRSAGSGSPPFPAFSATMQPSDSPASFGLGSGSPRRRPTAARPLVLDRLARATATGGRWRVVSGSPWHRFSDCGDAGASQVTGPSSARVPRSSTPPGASSPSPLERLQRRRHCCLQAIERPGHSGSAQFRGRYPSAHLLARLRFASSVAGQDARLTSGLPGSALAGRDLHPLDDVLDFTPYAFPPDQPCLVASQKVCK